MATIKHICLRYFIVPIEESLLTLPTSREQKIAWFRHSFLRNDDFTLKSGRELAVRITKEEDHLVFGKLSRKHYSSIRDKTPDDIKERKEEDWPYVGFVCDLGESQQLVVEFDSVLMKNTGNFAKMLEEIVNPSMFVHGYAVSFEPIVDDASFWKIIDRSDRIYALTFLLNSPNLFGAGSAANESLKQLQKLFNNTKLKVTLTNESGQLKVRKDDVNTYLEYADKGGGEWRVTTQQKTRKRKYTSTDRAVKIPIEGEQKGNIETLTQAIREFLKRI